MKIAIRVPDALFRSADALARTRGVTRRWLYATALAEYVANCEAAHVTERLKAVYGSESSAREAGMRRAQRRAIAPSDWSSIT
ncbi:MAG TPA: hypothetical protein VH116_09620 [Gemmatimonadales bacterium]|jgi:predicted transcriptional regulator|nr:hypothetical protein [Gemmatimonadales bacterium]